MDVAITDIKYRWRRIRDIVMICTISSKTGSFLVRNMACVYEWLGKPIVKKLKHFFRVEVTIWGFFKVPLGREVINWLLARSLMRDVYQKKKNGLHFFPAEFTSTWLHNGIRKIFHISATILMSPNSLEKRAANARHSHFQSFCCYYLLIPRRQTLGLRTLVSMHTTLKLLVKGSFQNLHIVQVQPSFLL